MSQPRTDEELMVAYARDDARAFDELYARYERRVYGFLRAKLPESDCDEVFQAVFLKLHRTRARFDPKYRFAPWIFLICRSVLIDAARTRQVYRRGEEPFDESTHGQLPEVETEGPILPDLAALSATDRQLLDWRYVQSLPFEEMGRRLGVGPVAVRKRVSRAIARLRGRMKGESHG